MIDNECAEKRDDALLWLNVFIESRERMLFMERDRNHVLPMDGNDQFFWLPEENL